MFDYDKWQEIFNTIRKHKLRTFLTALGVFWGIFMLIFLMGSGKGLENGVMGMFGDRATNSLYVWSQRTTKPYKGLMPGRRTHFMEDDVQAIKESFPQIQYIAPRLGVPSGEITHGKESASFDLRGEYPDLLNIEALEVRKGRFINELDLKNKRKVAVIGKRVQDVLFKDNKEAIGEYINIKGIDFLVVGIFGSKRKGESASEDEQAIFMPLTTAQQITNRPNRIGWFVCTMHPNIEVGPVEKKIKALLRKRHRIAPDDEQAIGSFNLEEEFREMQGLFTGINMLVWFVGIGSLLAGVIGVGNIMLIVVKERTKEIGVRKALGATPRDIISMILMESVFITTLAGYCGLLFSTGIIALMNLAAGEGSDFFANPEVDLNAGLGAILILVVAGAFAGLIPAFHAANINPVLALKDE